MATATYVATAISGIWPPSVTGARSGWPVKDIKARIAPRRKAPARRQRSWSERVSDWLQDIADSPIGGGELARQNIGFAQ